MLDPLHSLHQTQLYTFVDSISWNSSL